MPSKFIVTIHSDADINVNDVQDALLADFSGVPDDNLTAGEVDVEQIEVKKRHSQPHHRRMSYDILDVT